MSSHLHNEIPFPGGWTWPRPEDAAEDTIASGHLVALRDGQVAELESDFLNSHLTFGSCGFYGVYPDGEGFVFAIQQAPFAAAGCVDADDDPHEVLRDSLRRALTFNPAAELVWQIDWSGEDLLDAYEGRGVPRADVAAWPVLRGLLAECCRVSLRAIVAGRDNECAFPGRAHVCQDDAFSDVYARWTIDLEEAPRGPPARSRPTARAARGARACAPRRRRPARPGGASGATWSSPLASRGSESERTALWGGLEHAYWSLNEGGDVDYRGVACNFVRDDRIVHVER